MLSKLKEFLEQGKWKKLKKSDWAVLALAGVLLLVIAMPTGSGKNVGNTGGNTTESKGGQMGSALSAEQETGGMEAGGTGGDTVKQEEYVEYLEKKLKNVLSQMEGVGKVEVMITVSDGGETVVEKDKKAADTVTSESDSNGGTRTVSENTSENTTIYVETEEGTYPYVQKEKLPSVVGVVVVAEGGGNAAVVSDISESVEALLQVEAHRIRVVKMCSKEE